MRLDRDASQGGTYHGLDPMGLFWSYIPAKGQNIYHRMIKTDVMNPYDVTLSVWDRRMNAEDFDKEGQPTSESLCQYHLQRCYMKDGVKRIEMSEGRLKGTLFLPTEVRKHLSSYFRNTYLLNLLLGFILEKFINNLEVIH